MRVAGTRWASRNAISLFPAAVGPQITGMKECSSAAKAALELVPREMHDGRPAMDVVRGKLRRRERDEEQALRGHLAALQGAHEPLEEYSLMRRMLVDEDDAILPLEHQIRSA